MILNDLRAGTAAYHRSIEQVMPRFDESLHLHAYRDVLVRFYTFHKPMEAEIAQLLEGKPHGLQYEKRQRAELLKNDLRFFFSPQEITQFAECPQLPHLGSWAGMFGALYVLEGSTLGGQVITKQLRTLGIPSEATAFFAGYGAETGKMWKAFQAELEAHIQSPEDRQEAVRAAQETFSCLEGWLREMPMAKLA